ncbi:MAG: tRNA (adenosine(37)-N6)-threonylcarbamoyltransferase complex ATPase subunit type 1 TsaE [Bacteroides sp.]|nr:tRNA (adenosine(37)-N6)-threonylcarbamoyltransferase complex ATPase subunit type 1 TsaE [Bacteroides sp.]MBD5418948.1 tRNA (adenosine(37)-N6)-threonylcarbamoyltransferase complex ATPase subunit type 1 TsaE [Bacteroides sp.]
MKEIIIKDIADLDRAAKEFIGQIGENTVFAFHGEMGAGKTTFISAICRALGVEEDDISSPTFAIVNEYRSDSTAELIYHFDCYRIEDDEEALDMGVEDYFDSGALCFIEWPDRIENFLPEDVVNVAIEELPSGERRVSFN